MKRFRTIAFALLLLCLAALLLEYLAGVHSLYALLLAPLALTRSVIWRSGLTRILTIVAVALIPIVLRRRARLALVLALRRIRRRLAVVWVRTKRVWMAAPVWVTTFLGLFVLIVVAAAAILSGSVLWVVAFLPFVAKSAVGFAVIRWLAHTAAGRGLQAIAPHLLGLLPAGWRHWFRSRYRHLWWWTMRRIVRHRRRIERRLRGDTEPAADAETPRDGPPPADEAGP